VVASRREWPLAVSLATLAVFLVAGERWRDDLSSVFWFTIVLGWLFAAILVSAFAVVRHAEGWPRCSASRSARSC